MPDTATEIAIATQTLSSTASSITFSSIPSTYTDLRLVIVASLTSGNDNLGLQFNSDTATNYSFTTLGGTGALAQSARGTSVTTIDFNDRGSMSTQLSTFTSDVFSYAGSTYKTTLNTTSNDKNGSGTVERTVGLWRSTSAITSIKIFTFSATTMAIGTTATLYGIL